MATYKQWAQHAAQRLIRKVTWVCGPERILVEEVVDYIRQRADPTDLVQLTGGIDKDRDIWAAVNQYPSDAEGRRLVQVRQADQVRSWAPLAGWLGESRLTPNSFLLLVSDEDDFDTERPSHRLIVDKPGWMVRCNHLEEIDAIAWLCQRNLVIPSLARHALTRTAGDLTLADHALWKAKLLTDSPPTELIDHLCSPSAADTFSDALIFNRRQEALRSLPDLSPDDYGKAIGQIYSRLEVLAKMHQAAKRGQGPREMSADRGISPYLARLLYPAVRSYDGATIDRRTVLLTSVDSHLREGARDGLLEGLAALW